jgi:glycosyltransferase involved in cell wall biosynthesis
MNILVLTTSFPANDADYRGRFVFDLAHHLTRRSHRALVLTPHPGASARHKEGAAGVSVHRIRYPFAIRTATGSLFGQFGILETLRRQPWRCLELAPATLAVAGHALLKARWADLVISNWALPMGLIGATLSRHFRPRHILIEHGAGARLLSTLDRPQPILNELVAGTDLFHFVSQGMATVFRQLVPAFASPQGPAYCVHPMPAPRQSGAHIVRLYRPPLRLLFVGRFIPIKGVDVLLEALHMTQNVHLTLAGDGPELDAARGMAQSLGLGSRTQFLGEVGYRRLTQLYSQHDALVIPSRSLASHEHQPPRPQEEGSPRTLLEGMSMGLIPIVSASGGMPDIISHQTNGLLFPPNQAHSLAKQINLLTQSPSLCRRLSQAALETPDHCSFDTLFALWRSHGIDV